MIGFDKNTIGVVDEPVKFWEEIIAQKIYLIKALLSGRGNSKLGTLFSEKGQSNGIKVFPTCNKKLSSSTFLRIFNLFKSI